MINQYINTVLKPTLKSLKTPDDIIEIVSKDIKHRLSSVISVWSDIPFRNAILMMGKEEATFYEPVKRNILIRSLVVVAIRNSLLEDLHSYTTLSRFVNINNKEIVKITKNAIEFFSTYNLSKEAKKLKGYDSMYVNLAKKYPAAWKALEELGNLKGNEKRYDPVPTDLNKAKDNLKSFLYLTNNHYLDPETKILREVQSGIDNRISESSYNQLVNGKYIVTDCFKTLTRNPEKLLAMIEFILSKNAPLVSTNIYIENGYVSMASQFIKPSRGTERALIKNFNDRIKMGGILPNHMSGLNLYVQQLELSTN